MAQIDGDGSRAVGEDAPQVVPLGKRVLLASRGASQDTDDVARDEEAANEEDGQQGKEAAQYDLVHPSGIFEEEAKGFPKSSGSVL